MEYRVELDVYNGPVDLLLYLIKRDELDIYDIPIAQITDSYMQYVNMLRMMSKEDGLDINVAGDFLVMAATLMEIKSRMLLPRPEPVAVEEEGHDPRAELVARLLEYERFQQIAEQLREMEQETKKSFPRSVVEQWEGAVPLVELRAGDLLEAIRRMTGEQENEQEAASRSAALRVRRHGVNLRQRVAEVLPQRALEDGVEHDAASEPVEERDERPERLHEQLGRPCHDERRAFGMLKRDGLRRELAKNDVERGDDHERDHERD